MNEKIKTAIIVALALVFITSAIYVAPTLAYMNGSTDQIRDRDMDRTRNRDCIHDCYCDQDQNQTHSRIHLQECAQNQSSMNPANWQHQYGHHHRHRNMLLP